MANFNGLTSSANGLQEAPERNDTSTVKDSAQIKARQGIESYIESTGDRDSIDLNGPEALYDSQIYNITLC